MYPVQLASPFRSLDIVQKLPHITGSHPSIRKLRSDLPRLARSDAPLLIIGEPGVGKSSLAARIHALGRWKAHPMQVVNCRLLSGRDQRVALLGGGPPDLTTTRRSVFENPTTLLLKEIDCASSFLQDRVAGMLSTGRIERPGSGEVRPVRSRVIFSLTTRSRSLLRMTRLTSSLAEVLGALRRITIPPLRERVEDLPWLARTMGGGTIDRRALSLLQKHEWSGNLAELKAYLRSLMVVSPEEALLQHERIELFRMITLLGEGREFSLKESLQMIEGRILERALLSSGGCRSGAAKLLGLTDRDLRRKIRRALASNWRLDRSG